jgi:hypothetical protein
MKVYREQKHIGGHRLCKVGGGHIVKDKYYNNKS